MLSSRRDEAKAKETSDVIIDRLNNKRYLKGRFLGKGGFAKCYELTDIETRQVYAGKIVPKSMLVKQHHRDKLIQEIKIHKSVSHAHIVGFYGYVEDDENVYILLELCRRRSLMELHKRRHTITEPECRYFVHQIALACHYLHKLQIIHRDLKLGNLFLNDELEIKIGDFGLATKLDYEGERKKTLCGTPNYIAPEILSKKGHSYEVDSWSLGCIVYTLLVGKPPFETPSLKDTYIRISRNEYHLPSSLSRAARHFIRQLLHPEPSLRPNMEQVLGHEFLTLGFMPLCLPTSCLTMPPHFDILRLAKMERKGSVEEESPETASPPCSTGPVEVQAVAGDNGEYVTEQMRQPSPGGNNDDDDYNDDEKAQPTAAGGAVTTASGQRCDYHLSDLYSQLTKVIESQAPSFDAVNDVLSDDAEDPAAVPIYWISKWVDYSDKYGLGYQLSDNSIGVLFNDSTRLLLNRNMQNIQYIERDGIEHFHTLKSFPETLTKKVTLLKYFRNYMQEHLLKAGADIEPRCSDEMTRLPFLRTWFRTRSAIVLHLNNGTLQINFFQDHTKIILCPLMGAVTYIDECRDSRTYRLQLICEFGCCKQLASRLRYAFAMVQRLLAAKSYRPRSTASAAPIATNAAAAAAATAADY